MRLVCSDCHVACKCDPDIEAALDVRMALERVGVECDAKQETIARLTAENTRLVSELVELRDVRAFNSIVVKEQATTHAKWKRAMLVVDTARAWHAIAGAGMDCNEAQHRVEALNKAVAEFDRGEGDGVAK